MDAEYFIEKVGKKNFEETSKRAVYRSKNWNDKSLNSLDDPNGQKDYDLLSDLVRLIMKSELDHKKKIDIIFDLYHRAPSFTIIDHLFVFYWKEMLLASKNAFWKHFKEIISSNIDYLVNPIEYSLWCDFFENPDTVKESWHALVEKEMDDEILKKVLLNCGPVPFHLKKVLYYRYLATEYWHYYIFRSLLHSQFDVYGDIEKEEALKILNRLKLPKDTEHLELLFEKLNEA